MAAMWYATAAKQGLLDARYALALCYARGAGVDQDLPLAEK